MNNENLRYVDQEVQEMYESLSLENRVIWRKYDEVHQMLRNPDVKTSETMKFIRENYLLF